MGTERRRRIEPGGSPPARSNDRRIAGPTPERQSTPANTTGFACDICGKVVSTERGVKSHKTQVHERPDQARVAASQPSTSRRDEPTLLPCPNCDRFFGDKIGLGVHRQSQHREEYNAELRISQSCIVWQKEELKIARNIEAPLRVEYGERRIPDISRRIQQAMAYRTLSSVQNMRKVNKEYKEMVRTKVAKLRSGVLSDSSESEEEEISETETPSSGCEDEAAEDGTSGLEDEPDPRISLPTDSSEPTPQSTITPCRYRQEVQTLLQKTAETDNPIVAQLNIIAQDFLDNRDVSDACVEWVRTIAGLDSGRLRSKVRRSRRRHRRKHRCDRAPSRKRQRRSAYAKVQELWKKDMSKAAKLVLDGEMDAITPSIQDMVNHWEPVFTSPSVPVEQPEARPNPRFEWLIDPITIREVDRVKIPVSSASGCDKLTFRQWRGIPSTARALFFNLVLALGSFPSELLVSRTTFAPKKNGSSQPADFRPLSIASVAVRHLHKIIVRRLMRTNTIDHRQRALVDGCAENITALSAIIADAKERRKELHLVVTDVAKAFDSVSHPAIRAVLLRQGFPTKLVDYIMTTYHKCSTVLEVGKSRSHNIKVSQGVRQGDPMSTYLFALIMDKVIQKVSKDIGYELSGQNVNELLYADDEIKFASSRAGMQASLLATEEEAKKQGLHFNPAKCLALSLIPVGGTKKIKVASAAEVSFRFGCGSAIRQLGPTDVWTYLGVQFTAQGAERPGRSLERDLEKITKAPLKPQQRIKILRCFLLPRFYHKLVMSKCSKRLLKALDRQVYSAVRKWLHMPRDVPTPYFHAACRDGGLGIPSFQLAIPGQIFDRLSALEHSDSPITRAVFRQAFVQKKRRWAEEAITIDGIPLTTTSERQRYWRDRLYASVDGSELRESWKSTVSTSWIDQRSQAIPGRDYVQYHRIHINTLPTRMRLSRGRRTPDRQVLCRAGCPDTETAAHVIQQCLRTHGGRVLRHNAVCRVVGSALQDKDWQVTMEPHLNTSAGLRKPDIVAVRGENLVVLDTQIVSGAPHLMNTYRDKVAKYNTPELKDIISRRFGVALANIKVAAVTISWRGVWAAKSEEVLQAMGLAKGTLHGLTTRVLQGSHTNWTRFNAITTTIHGIRARTGVG